MSREEAALIILIVLCMIAFRRLHTHSSQLGVFDLADTESVKQRERERETSEAASN